MHLPISLLSLLWYLAKVVYMVCAMAKQQKLFALLNGNTKQIDSVLELLICV